MLLLTYFDGTEKLGEVELSGRQVTIGRDPENHVVLNEASVSRHHAVLEPQGTFYIIRDRGSANGTFLNDHQVKVHLLENEDTVRVGRFTLKVTEAKPGRARAAAGRAGVAAAGEVHDEEMVLR